ncbi:MAG TPA: hypothetical protein VJ831_13680 [Jatrophihabitantaceae bacterium]|nr:hypothetical protein [Jatrophihabitantaceae bacterium]
MTTPSRPTLDQLSKQQIDAEDIRVLALVAAMYDAVDPVPSSLVERVQFGITLDALHAEIAELQRGGDLVGVRGDEVTEAQTITFTSSSLTTMVTITPTSTDLVRIDGWITPGAGVSVELRLESGSRHTEADEDGRFVLDGVTRGYAQFVIRPRSASGQSAVVTPSIEL